MAPRPPESTDEGEDRRDAGETGADTTPPSPPMPSYLRSILNDLSPGGVWVPSSERPLADPAPLARRHDQESIVSRRVIPWLEKAAPAIAGSGGSNRTMSVARTVCWEFGLGESAGFDVLWDNWNPRCEPPWLESELRRKCRDAIDSSKAQTAFGHKCDEEQPARTTTAAGGGVVVVGQGEGDAPPIGPTPTVARPNRACHYEHVDDPHRLARKFDEATADNGRRCWVFYRDEFFFWRDGGYQPVPDSHLRAVLTQFAREQFETDIIAQVNARRRRNDAEGKPDDGSEEPPKMKSVRRSLIGDVMQALAGMAQLPPRVESPCWVDDRDGRPDPKNLLAAPNGITDFTALADRNPAAIYAPTPLLFTTTPIGPRIDARSPRPGTWLSFLAVQRGYLADS